MLQYLYYATKSVLIKYEKYRASVYVCHRRFRLRKRNSLFALSFFLIPKLSEDVWISGAFLFPSLEIFNKKL